MLLLISIFPSSSSTIAWKRQSTIAHSCRCTLKWYSKRTCGESSKDLSKKTHGWAVRSSMRPSRMLSLLKLCQRQSQTSPQSERGSQQWKFIALVEVSSLTFFIECLTNFEYLQLFQASTLILHRQRTEMSWKPLKQRESLSTIINVESRLQPSGMRRCHGSLCGALWQCWRCCLPSIWHTHLSFGA